MEGQFISRGFTGVNEALDPEFIADNDLAVLQNCVIDKAVVVSRNGYFQYNTNGLATPIYALAEATDQAGTTYLLGASGTKLYRTLGTGAWTEIASGLSANVKFSMTPVGSGMYLFNNGVNMPRIIRGNGFATSTDYKVTRPETSGVMIKAESTTDPKQSLDAGIYRWVITYQTAIGEESSASKPLAFILETDVPELNSGYKLTFTNIPNSVDTRVVRKNIYRTQAAGDIYYFVGSINADETEFIDRYKDTDLDLGRPLDFKIEINKAQYVSNFRGRVFYSNIEYAYTHIAEPSYTKRMLGDVASEGTYGQSVYDDGTYVPAPDEPQGNYIFTSYGEHNYKVVFVDADGVESTPYNFSVTTEPHISDRPYFIILHNLPMLPINQYGYNKKRIYRSPLDNSSEFYLVEEIPIDVMKYVDSFFDDAMLLNEHEYSFAYKTVKYTDGIVFSNQLKPTDISVNNVVRVYPNDSEGIVGVFSDELGLVVFKDNSICRVYTDGSQFSWRIIKIIDNIGCDQKESFAEHNGAIFFMYKKRLYVFQGNQVQYISEKFKDSMSLINRVESSTFYTTKQWYVASVYLDTQPKSTMLYVYDLITQTFYKFTTMANTLAVLERQYGNDKGTLIFSAFLANYILYKYDLTRRDDQGEPITSVVRTKTFTAGDSITLRPRFMYINLRSYIGNLTFKLSDGSTVATLNEIHGGGETVIRRIITDLLTSGGNKLMTADRLYIELSGQFDKVYSFRLECRILNRGRIK